MLPIALKGISTSALLDSGSSKSFVNGDLMSQLKRKFPKLKIQEVEESCTLANAHQVNVNQRVSLTVHFDNFTWKHDFLILETLLTPVILGRDD